MAVQTVGSALNQQTVPGLFSYNSNKSSNSQKFQNTSNLSGSNTGISVKSEYYSAEKYAFEFVSDDGDKVSFSYEALTYSSTSAEIDSKNSSTDRIKQLHGAIKEQLRKVAQDIVKDFMKDSGVKTAADSEEISDIQDSELAIPEYWNAENTSQRIVDFAVSFYGKFNGKGEEFLGKIKDAIEEGFNQAKKFWGDVELPESVNNLVKSTHDLIMEKLDKWAGENGISVNNSAEQTTDVKA